MKRLLAGVAAVLLIAAHLGGVGLVLMHPAIATAITAVGLLLAAHLLWRHHGRHQSHE